MSMVTTIVFCSCFVSGKVESFCQAHLGTKKIDIYLEGPLLKIVPKLNLSRVLMGRYLDF